jgi:oligopeptidase A
MTNPLLERSELPLFDRIRAEHVEPAVTELLDELAEALPALEETAVPTWQGLVEPIDEAWERFGRAWSAVSHLHGVANTPALREAYQRVQPRVVEASLQWAQSKKLHEAFGALRGGAEWDTLDAAQQRIVEQRLRDARLSGIELAGEAQRRFNEIQAVLSEVATDFSNHVLDATKAFFLHLTSLDEVAGLPKSALLAAAHAAKAAGFSSATPEEGPWRVTLDAPSYVAFMKHGQHRELREKLYKAYLQRASSGELDNTPLMDRILSLRQEKARLLGYSSFAALSLATKMADRVEEIERLLGELVVASKPAAQQDLEDLKALAREGVPGVPQNGELRNWDLELLGERLRERRYSFTDEEVRPYFPLPRVLDGLFALVRRLFGVQVRAADGEVPVWHADVRFFRVFDEQGAPMAAFYLDPYTRPEDKRGGAWMDDLVTRRRRGGEDEVRLPVAVLACNQTPPMGEDPSLMTFREVETLFHEFGHGLQHMLTRVDYPDAAGINGVEWDAVELPSQFMENWCYHKDTLLSLARHYETGAQLPNELFEKIKAARTYRAASMMLRQVEFARVDLELHHSYTPGEGESPFDVRARVARETLVVQPIDEDRFLCGFTHIFAGGYAAGYYSYKWAEVLSADAFGAFEDAGLDDEAALAQVGQRFRDTVLALGGGQHPMEVFKAFRGREPSTEALLRHSGLAA